MTRDLPGAGRVGWIATHGQVLIPWPRALSLWKEPDKPCKVGRIRCTGGLRGCFDGGGLMLLF
jgi:hypothetical protein